MLTLAFKTHFRQRRSEWLLALAMLAVGLAYLLIPGLFDNRYFTTMAGIMAQRSWAVLVTGFGLMRLTMLWINGRWRISPYFRTAGAIGGAGLWMTLFMSAATSEALVQSVGLWLLFFLFDTIAAADAAADARQAHDTHARIKAAARHGSIDARAV